MELIEPSTARLRLRQWREDDLDPFAALNADPAVMACYPATLGRAASDALAHRLRGLIAERGWGFWAVGIQGGPPFIGFVGLQATTAQLPFTPCIEIGWRLAREHWGQGYASEAAQAALEVAFTRLGLAEVVSFTAAVNRRSRAVMQRIGMTDSSEDFLHPALPDGHELKPHVLYRITAVAWHGRMARAARAP